MNAEGDAIPSPAPSATEKRPRGRPRQTAAETPEQKVARIREELRQAETALKLSEEKRAGIVGLAALRHARRNVEFSRQLAAALRAEVKAKTDRTLIADLIAGDSAAPSG